MRTGGDTDQLLYELGSEDPAERMYALAALAMVDTPESLGELVAALRDPSRDCRASAARLLGDRAEAAAVPALIDALLDSSTDIAQEAAEALGRIGDLRAAQPLMVVLREYSAAARAAAARALGALKATQSASALQSARRQVAHFTSGPRAPCQISKYLDPRTAAVGAGTDSKVLIRF